MNTRKEGYYWVRFAHEWMVVYWTGIVFTGGSEYDACAGYGFPDEINETRIPSPDERNDMSDLKQYYLHFAPEKFEEIFGEPIPGSTLDAVSQLINGKVAFTYDPDKNSIDVYQKGAVEVKNTTVTAGLKLE